MPQVMPTTATAPRTLLELSNATPQAASLADAVVVVIDAQREYVDGLLPLEGVRDALREIEAVLSRARQNAAPIVHVRHHGASGGAFDPNGAGFTFAPGAEPLVAEPQAMESIVNKTLPDAFADTDLNDILQGFGRKKLLVMGFMTHMCISSTVRAALAHGYFSTVVARATATRALPGAEGNEISATMLQQTSLAALADRFAVVIEDASALTDQP